METGTTGVLLHPGGHVVPSQALYRHSIVTTMLQAVRQNYNRRLIQKGTSLWEFEDCSDHISQFWLSHWFDHT
jgi:hypothetical protein